MCMHKCRNNKLDLISLRMKNEEKEIDAPDDIHAMSIVVLTDGLKKMFFGGHKYVTLINIYLMNAKKNGRRKYRGVLSSI